MPPVLRTVLAALACLLFPSAAFAQFTPSGAKHTLAIDQISGFRASNLGGINYAGPIGVSFHHASAAPFNGNRFDDAVRATTFWIMPSADYFVIDHLSIGGLVEFATTSSSVDIPVNNTTTQSVSLPTTTNFTLLPRVGYLIGIGEHFAIWPRGGIGYASRQVVLGNDQNAARESSSGGVLDLDVGFLYRINTTFFLRAAPELAFSLGESHSQVTNNGTLSANASFVQFSIASGIGVFVDL